MKQSKFFAMYQKLQRQNLHPRLHQEDLKQQPNHQNKIAHSITYIDNQTRAYLLHQR